MRPEDLLSYTAGKIQKLFYLRGARAGCKACCVADGRSVRVLLNQIYGSAISSLGPLPRTSLSRALMLYA